MLICCICLLKNSVTHFWKGSHGAAVKLLPCDHGSWVQVLETTSYRNAGKCCVHKTQSDRTLLRSLRKRELCAPGCPFFSVALFSWDYPVKYFTKSLLFMSLYLKNTTFDVNFRKLQELMAYCIRKLKQQLSCIFNKSYRNTTTFAFSFTNGSLNKVVVF
jgi:hypothetical protein